MARRTRSPLALPAQAGKDIKAVTNIVDRWAVGVEDVMKSAFDWAKKHKFLVLVSAGLFLFWRYWMTEEDTEEEYE